MKTDHELNRAVLATLAEGGEWFVRKTVARNPDTSIETLKKLSTDMDTDIRKAAEITLTWQGEK